MTNKRRKAPSKQDSPVEDLDELETPVVPDAQQLLRESDRFTNLMLGIFCGVGLILSLVAILMAVNINRTTANEIKVQGVVTQMMIGEYENGDKFYFPVVEFPLADGTRQTVQLNEGSSTADYDPGQPVIIRYQPGKADDARIQSAGSTVLRWLGPILIGLVGAAFFAMTAFAWNVFRREKEERSE